MSIIDSWWRWIKKKTRVIDDDDAEDIWPNDGYSGIWEIYWPNGVVKFRANYVDGKEEGECLCYWDNGNLAQRGVKVRGECDGICRLKRVLQLRLTMKHYIEIPFTTTQLGHRSASELC
jgi:hypothetical protein